MLLHHRVPLSIEFAGIHLYTWVEGGTVRVRCPAQGHNSMSPASAQTTWSGVARTYHAATAITWNLLARTSEGKYTTIHYLTPCPFVFVYFSVNIASSTLPRNVPNKQRNKLNNLNLYSRSSKSTSFYVSFLSRVKTSSINWSTPKIGVFIAQLVEHCSKLNAIEALNFIFGLKFEIA